jgi:hypothetical protein
VATEAAWLNGNNLGKEEINEAEKEKKRKDDRKTLTLTGLLMEGLIPPSKPDGLRLADEPLTTRKRYGVNEEISLSFLRARQASGLLV